jgi:murein DD-endopeptidase MepM/ murein hydrolase activator NlpD
MRILSQSLSESARSRITWATAGAVTLVFGVVAAFGTVQDALEPVFARTVVEPLALSPIPEDKNIGKVFFREDRFQRGDTISVLLERLDVDDQQAQRLLRSPEAKRPFRLLRPGTTVQARTAEDGSLLSMWFIGGRDQLISIDGAGEDFTTSERPAELTRRVVMKSGAIKSSLYAATDAAGLSDSVATQIADMFAGDVDFHRDLRRGDKFTIVYEMFDHLGRPVKSGRVLAAEFINQKKSYRAVWFQDAEGHGGYYAPDGKNLRKAFLRSPLEFSRITSGFAMRFHPILQQWRAHRGVDYGAPTGTRVKATGEGVVEFVGRQGGYGNVVVLRHGGGIMTAYGHLSRFANGIRKGARVGQGELVGLVGQTGWATGPHLHYEFRVNNLHRNPLTIAFPAALPVAPERQAAFRAIAGPLAARLDLLVTTNIALLE